MKATQQTNKRSRPTPGILVPYVEEVSALERAIQFFEAKNWRAAESALDEVPAERDNPIVQNYRARIFEAEGRLEEALDRIKRCVELQPHNVADLRNLGILLTRLDRFEDALAAYRAALDREPQNIELLIKVAFLLHRLERREDALAEIEKAVVFAPTDLPVRNTRGMIYDSLGRYEDALADFDFVLETNSMFVDAINNRGMIHARYGRLHQALQCYDTSLAIDADQPQAKYNRAMILLTAGDWANGFKEFEVRWDIAPLEATRFTRLKKPWLGEEDLRGKTIILHHEQGYGDSLQFARYATLVARRGARVILAVPTGLRKLMQSLPIRPEVICEGEAIPDHDFYCPLMSLPLAFRSTPADVPQDIPYLWAERTLSRAWAERLGPRQRLRVGLAWSGRRYPPVNYTRDMPLAGLSPLFKQNADFYCLQKDATPDEKLLAQAAPNLHWVGDLLGDFSDTAALIDNLDLVITVDTAVAHLAAALGKPVWLMNRFATCWRWLQGPRHDTPWYPNVRIFRQRQPLEWDSVVSEVSEAASRLINQFGVTSNVGSGSDVQISPAEAEKLKSALALHADNKLTQAVLLYEELLASSPGRADVLHFAAIAYAQSGRTDDARRLFATLVALDGTNFNARNHLGSCLFELNRFSEALIELDHAIQLNPQFSDPHYNRGLVLRALGNLTDAERSYRRAIALREDYAEAHNNLGILLTEEGKHDEALKHHERACEIAPNSVGMWVNLSNALRRVGRDVDALASSDKALAVDVESVEAHSAKGAALAELGEVAAGLESYNRAIALNPSHAVALWNKALIKLADGDFTEGWPLYEARWRIPQLGLRHRCGDRPPWLGESSIEGKRILIHAEQGYGDTIQFCRYAIGLKKRGAYVILGVPGPLKSLMNTLYGVDEIAQDGPLPPFDEHCPLLSLPLALGGLGPSDIPSQMPYLYPDRTLADAFEQKMGVGNQLRVGIAWAGKGSHSNDRNRSIPFKMLGKLLASECRFVSLQKEIPINDVADLEKHSTVWLFNQELGEDFLETAALISHLDLVIAVDTAVAHLAGALGKEVWILLPLRADWRWLRNRTDTPWYPTATLFRQRSAGDWETVIHDVVNAVNSRISENQWKQRSPHQDREAGPIARGTT